MTSQITGKKRKLFEVTTKLECAYPKRGKVLEVGGLDIYPGEIVVIIGNSGAGKSTLIETLGLMTDTLSTNRQNEGKGEIVFYPTTKPEDVVKIPEVWKKGTNDSEVTRIRRENFNFIFQDNNLMQNLKNDENVILADLIDGDLTYRKSKRRTNATFNSLNIKPDVGENIPMNVSGGERQRVAFARGIQPKFKILFGDEPTGNLDEENADNLMKYLQKQIPVESEDKAAIIVSHNIDLSLKFADKIIVLTKLSGNGYFEILPEYTFIRKSRDINTWEGKFPIKSKGPGSVERKFPDNSAQTNFVDQKKTLSELEKFDYTDIPSVCSDINFPVENQSQVNILNLKGYIKHILKKNAENGFVDNNNEKIHITIAVKIMTYIGMSIMSAAKWLAGTFHQDQFFANLSINKDFSQLLFRKECEQLAGKKNSNILFLFISIFITFIIIGLANGQLQELKNDLMKDPFTLTLDVMHRGGEMQIETRKILNEILSDQDTMNFYNIDQISEFDRNFLTFYDFDDKDKDQFYLGRSMRYDDPLIGKILDPGINPNVTGRGFNSNNDMGLIVTIDLLNDLNYDVNSPVIYCKVYDPASEQYLSVALPIIAIVDQLPGSRKNYFLYTPNFYDYYTDETVSFPFMPQKNIKIAACINPGKITEMKQEIEKALNGLDIAQIPDYDGYRKVEVDTSNNFRDKVYEFIIYPQINNRDLFDQKILIDSLFGAKEFRDYLSKNDLIAGKDIFQVFYFEIPPVADDAGLKQMDGKERGNISFLFKDPSKIKEFAKMFTARTQAVDEEEKEGLLMDIGKVESMFIFSRISSLTYSILIILILIIVYANMQYISNLLNMHLYKIRRNIGTLMAFGVNIKTIYHFLMLSFVIYCFVLSFILAFVTGYFVLGYFGVLPFSLYSGFRNIDVYITIGAVLLIFAGSYLVYFYAAFQYFRKTPSQLIYNRIENGFWGEFWNKLFKWKKVN
jgi:putative ABC transport system ATP-binding protein